MSAAYDDEDDAATTVRTPGDRNPMMPARRRRPRPTPTTAPPPARFAVGTHVLPRAALAPRPRPPSPTLMPAAPSPLFAPSPPLRLRDPLPMPLPPPRFRSQPDAQPVLPAPLAWHWTALAAIVALTVGFAVAFTIASFVA
jgi:hypothetical protein